MPAILDPFADGLAPTVMTWTALDWISHLVQAMLDVVSVMRPSANMFKTRRFDTIASVSAFYRKLGQMELRVSAAVVRETADRARGLIVAGRGPC